MGASGTRRREAIRSDVVVLGSGLGPLVAAAVLARVGLRVTLLEEDVQSKRPPLLREPFALTGLAPGEPTDTLLRDLAVPLIERRRIAHEPIAVQGVLPGARIDVGADRARLSAELDAYGVCARGAALHWWSQVDAAGDAVRASLQSGAGPRGWRLPRLLSTQRLLPDPPAGLEPLLCSLLRSLGAPGASYVGPEAALLLGGLRAGGFAMPSASEPFLDLFRRRLRGLFGEIRAVDVLALGRQREQIEVMLPEAKLSARACVVGVPLEPLRRAVSEATPAPRWLRPASPPLPTPLFLLRARVDALPVGMASRVVCAGADPENDPYWLVRSADASDPRVAWIALRGPGAVGAPGEAPLAALAPFSEGSIAPVEPGPEPRWDLAAPNLELHGPRGRLLLSRRPPVVCVGPEVSRGLGMEGEIALARRVAERLARRLGASTDLLARQHAAGAPDRAAPEAPEATTGGA